MALDLCALSPTFFSVGSEISETHFLIAFVCISSIFIFFGMMWPSSRWLSRSLRGLLESYHLFLTKLTDTTCANAGRPHPRSSVPCENTKGRRGSARCLATRSGRIYNFRTPSLVDSSIKWSKSVRFIIDLLEKEYSVRGRRSKTRGV